LIGNEKKSLSIPLQGTEMLGGTTLINHNRLRLLPSPAKILSVLFNADVRCAFTQKLQGRFNTSSARISHHPILSLWHILYLLILFLALVS